MNVKPSRALLLTGTSLMVAGAILLRTANAQDAGASPNPAPTVSARIEKTSPRAEPEPTRNSCATPCEDGLPPEAALAEFQTRLLQMAFRTASAIPNEPHIKDRSRAQERVIATCLELDQPRLASELVPKIANWRRGACDADLAFYCAEHKCTGKVQQYLDAAERIAEESSDWRRDRIRVKIAQTYALLGREEEAASFEAGVVDSESGKVERVRARSDGTISLDDRILALDAVVATGNFELTRNALWTYAELFDRHFDDETRRTELEARIKSAWTKVPVMVRIDVLAALANAALEHRDQSAAHALAVEMGAMVDDHRWTAEYEVPLRARVAGLMARAGDPEEARRRNEAALAAFDAGRQTIADVFRAEALRPVAEAYWAMGDQSGALAVYRRVVEAGVENPNSRPRAIDLSATCCSLAVQGIEPDEALWERLRQIADGLGDPW
ncbi:MAG: hypothetical protein KDA22_08350 [Phycisphaerales bacterium]|nr:hypothetical protein [Phycisphaerales bacterium]